MIPASGSLLRRVPRPGLLDSVLSPRGFAASVPGVVVSSPVLSAPVVFVGVLLLMGPALPWMVPALPFPTALAAQGVEGASWTAWLGSLDPDPRVPEEILRYRKDARPGLDPAEAQTLARRVNRGLTEAAGAAVIRLRGGTCERRVQVRFGTEALPPGGPSPSRLLQELEDGLVWVESVTCFPAEGTTPGAALDLLVSPAFRMEVEGRIRAMREEDGESCVETAGIPALLGPSRSCSRIRRFDQGGVASEHAQVVRNLDPASSQVVYLKESLKSTVAIPGGVALHYVHISRTADLGRARRWAAERSIREGEDRKEAGLKRALDLQDRASGVHPPR